MAEDLIEGPPLLRSDHLRLIHRGGADLAGGYVDDAPQPQIIGGVVDDAQIGQHILDLGPVEELHAADDLIGYAVALKGILHGVGLGVGSVEHGVFLPVDAPTVVHHNLPHYIVGLVGLIEAGLDGDDFPFSVLRPQSLALAAGVVADDGVGPVQNVLCRAVILLQTDGTGAGILLFKIQDVLDVGPPEAVDALIVVAYHADVAVSPCQQTGQQILQMVGVLILVDEDVAELALVVGQRLPVRPQQIHRVEDDIVEVQRIGVP